MRTVHDTFTVHGYTAYPSYQVKSYGQLTQSEAACSHATLRKVLVVQMAMQGSSRQDIVATSSALWGSKTSRMVASSLRDVLQLSLS